MWDRTVPVPTLNLTELTQGSSIVVTGKIVAARDGRQVAYNWQGQTILERVINLRPLFSAFCQQFNLEQGHFERENLKNAPFFALKVNNTL
jgi:hypothetical protein